MVSNSHPWRDPESLIRATAEFRDVVAKIQQRDPLWVVDDEDRVIGQIHGKALVRFLVHPPAEGICARDLMEAQPASPAASHENLLELLFQQTLAGVFFMLMDQPLDWYHLPPDRKADGLVTASEQQRVSAVNQAILDHYGCQAADLVGRSHADFFRHDPEQGRENLRQLLDHGFLWVVTEEHKSDGSPIWIEGHYQCLYDGAGRIIGHFGVQQDITAIREHYRLASEAQQYVRRITAAQPAAIYQVCPQENGLRFVFMSEAIQDLYGVSPAAWCANPQIFLEYVHPQDREGLAASVREAIAQRRDWRFEYRICPPGQPLKWIHGQSVAEALPDQQWVWTGCLYDITEHKQTEAELSQHQALLESVNNGIPGYVQRLIWDAADQSLSVAYISAGVERILGVSREALMAAVDTLLSRFIHPDDQDSVRADVEHLVTQGGSLQRVTRVVNANHEVRWLQSFDQSHPLDSQRIAIDSVLIDVTQQHQADQIHDAIIQVIPDLLVHLDGQGTCLNIFNRDSAKIVERGLPPGYRKADVLPPDLATRWTEAITSCLRTGTMQTFEQCLAIQGRQQYESVRIVPLDADSVLAVIRDQTENYLAQLALQESEARFRLLTENATDMISSKTPEGVYRYVSPACEKLLGYTPEEMIGRSAYTFFHPDDIPELQERHHQLLEQNSMRVTHRMRARNQQYLWVESSVRLIRDPQTQEPVEIQSVVRDIRERMAYENTLRLTNEQLRYEVDVRNAQLRQTLMYEELLRTISDRIRRNFDAASILQTTVDLLGQTLRLQRCQVGIYDPHTLTFTAEYEWFARADAGAAVGIPCAINPEVRSQLSQAMSLHYTTHHSLFGTVTLLTCSIQDASQPHRLLKLFRLPGQTFTAAEINLAEQVAQQGVIGIRQADLLQQSQEQVHHLQEANQIKDDFLHMVSHELRTPLTNMKMALTMLQTTADPQRQAHYLRILNQAWQQEYTLVNELLELQALESGTLQPVWKTFPLQAWIHEITQPFWERCQEQQQNLVLEVHAAAETITTDRGLLERVVLELLNNACKYTPPHEHIIVTVEACPALPQVLLKVTNTGVTIPTAEHSRIFEKFHRLPHLDPLNRGGTGLGLALAKKAVDLLGGHLVLTSRDQQTCFSVRLPNPTSDGDH